MKRFLKLIIPKPVISAYHYFLSTAAAFWYRLPSREMATIGVTGTKGKSTTVYLLGQILREAGKKVGWTSTISFCDGKTEVLNPIKMTMPGRFFLERMLRQMKNNNVEVAIIETSSEGLAQYRHVGILYTGAVFTNLAPEHLTAHGGYLNYKHAKGILFNRVAKKGKNGFVVINLDDAEAPYFVKQSAGAHIYGFTQMGGKDFAGVDKIFQIKNVITEASGVQFDFEGVHFTSPLLGTINVCNLSAAISVATILGVSLSASREAVARIITIPGRLEFIDRPNGDKIVVDYAHTPQSIEALYAALEVVPKKRIIHVLGPTGGGRDKDKIRLMGELVGQYADLVIVTTDDPYFDDPSALSEPMTSGAKEEGKTENHNLFWIENREAAIKKALELQTDGDLVIISGKGSEQKMAIGGKMINWDDRAVVKKLIQK